MIQVDETRRLARSVNHIIIPPFAPLSHSWIIYLEFASGQHQTAELPLLHLPSEIPNTANDPLPTAINRNTFWSQPMSRKCARTRAKWIVIASVLLMFHLQGWPCDCYSLLMPEQIKAMSLLPPPATPCQGHRHHRFTGLSAQVMHGSYSQSVFITNYGGRNQLITAETAGSLGCRFTHRFSYHVSVLLI